MMTRTFEMPDSATKCRSCTPKIGWNLSAAPRDRLDVMTREVLLLRDIARERVNRRRPIQLIQEFRHVFELPTFGAYERQRRRLFGKFADVSEIRNLDSRIIIPTFRVGYCSGCSARSPKVETTTGGEDS
jgi:hypothetical protein